MYEYFEGEKSMNSDELITVSECRQLREIIHKITACCCLTNYEYMKIMNIISQACNRMEREYKNENN